PDRRRIDPHHRLVGRQVRRRELDGERLEDLDALACRGGCEGLFAVAVGQVGVVAAGVLGPVLLPAEEDPRRAALQPPPPLRPPFAPSPRPRRSGRPCRSPRSGAVGLPPAPRFSAPARSRRAASSSAALSSRYRLQLPPYRATPTEVSSTMASIASSSSRSWL